MIQEELFAENYEEVEGDKRPGHKDGKLSLVLSDLIRKESQSDQEIFENELIWLIPADGRGARP